MQSRTKKSMSRARLISEAMRVVGPWYHGQRERSGGGGDGRGRSISHLAKSRNAAAAVESTSISSPPRLPLLSNSRGFNFVSASSSSSLPLAVLLSFSGLDESVYRIVLLPSGENFLGLGCGGAAKRAKRTRFFPQAKLSSQK